MKKHKDFPDYSFTEDGQVFSHLTNKFLKPRIDRSGYLGIPIKNKQGKFQTIKIHRIVAEIFISDTTLELEVNHIDGNKNNNHYTNLEWVSSKQNKEHAWTLGLYKDIGENHHSAVLTNEQVHNICSMLQDGMRNKDVAEIMNLHKDLISDIKTGRNWKQISSLYNFSVKRKDRVSEKTIRRICEMLQDGCKNREISDKLRVPYTLVQRVRTKVVYKNISCEYSY